MPIIIAGTLDFDPDKAETAIIDGKPYIEASLREQGCVHYAWTRDPLTPGRIYVFEEWASQTALEGHFRDQSYLSMRNHLGKYGLRTSSVKKYRFDHSEPVYDEAGTPRADFFEQGAAR